jgi:hypothetical protein
MRRWQGLLVPLIAVSLVAGVLTHATVTAKPAAATDENLLDCSSGLCASPDAGRVDGTIKIYNHIPFLTSVVGGTGTAEHAARTRAAWAALEARARAAVAIIHGVPNDDRLLVGARAEVRAMMFSDLLGLIKKRHEGKTLTADERGIVDELQTLIKQRDIDRAQLSLAEYDRWNQSPCFYQPPPGFHEYHNKICEETVHSPGTSAWDFPPTVDDFRAYGLKLEADRVYTDAADSARV